MRITQVRNATLQVDYGGLRFLIDPMLGEKGAYPAFPGTQNSHLDNPTVPCRCRSMRFWMSMP